MSSLEHRPLRHLELRTPWLERRPDDDEGLLELAEVSYGGVHHRGHALPHPVDRRRSALGWRAGPTHFLRPKWTVEVDVGCRALLGAA